MKISVLRTPLGRKEADFVSAFKPTYPDVFSWYEKKQQEDLVQDLYITNQDGLKLHAYYIPKNNSVATAILVHGYSGCALQTLPQAYMYSEEFSYNVLMLDLVNHAQSEGHITQMGWKDRIDIIQWIDYILQIQGNDLPIVLHGLSMGGASVLMTAGEKLPSCVKAVIDDSGYTSAYDEFAYEINHKMHIPATPLIQAANLVGRLFLGWSYSEASALKQMSKIQIPVFIIHGDKDVRVPLKCGQQLYEAKTNGYREMWVVPNGEHILAIGQYPDEYKHRVELFLHKAFEF